jgi:hypothetical protein
MIRRLSICLPPFAEPFHSAFSFSPSHVRIAAKNRNGAENFFGPSGQVNIASGSDRGFRKVLVVGIWLATARGTDSEVVRSGRFFVGPGRIA